MRPEEQKMNVLAKASSKLLLSCYQSGRAKDQILHHVVEFHVKLWIFCPSVPIILCVHVSIQIILSRV
jgi:hypothetical protein